MTKIQPAILVDSREQLPLDIQAYPTEVVGLPVGDYGIRGFSDWTNPAFIIERKSLSDLIGSLTSGRERYMREIEKMRQFQFAAIVIEATEWEVERWEYQSKTTPQSILQSLAAISVRTNVHVIWAMDRPGAVKHIERLVRQFVRGFEKQMKALRKAEKEDVTAQ